LNKQQGTRNNQGNKKKGFNKVKEPLLIIGSEDQRDHYHQKIGSQNCEKFVSEYRKVELMISGVPKKNN
jgi:hypothetical protein